MASSANALLSNSQTSDSRLQVQLHPLVILTISDYITRHVLRQQQGPIVGAILGSQHGRDITMEHAFECKLEAGQGEDIVLDASWFHSRLEQFKLVHKAPVLDLVGWFTLGSSDGPQPRHLPIHQQLLQNYNESSLLLLFHPSSVADGTSKGGKLPLAIYESVYETITTDDGDKQMSGGDGPQHTLRFQELPYTIETGEAEMISVDFVARGGANAAVPSDDANDTTMNKPPTPQKDGKGKGRAEPIPKPAPNTDTTAQTNGNTKDLILSPEDEDQIAALTAKVNAIRMLQQRIALLRSYLQALPSCYLTQPSQNTDPSTPHNIPTDLNLDHQILRQISSLLARLPLLVPTNDYANESHRQSSDVALTSLLGLLGTTLSTTQKMGRKAAVLEYAKNRESGMKGKGGGGGGGMGGFHGGGAETDGFGAYPMDSGNGGFAEEGFVDGGYAQEEVWDDMEQMEQ